MFKNNKVINEKNGEAQIQAMAWSPNNQKFAVCTADRVIHLFDDMGEKRDKFSTKPCDSKVAKFLSIKLNETSILKLLLNFSLEKLVI
jgi:hypothetical protein